MTKINKKCLHCRFGHIMIEVLAPEAYNVEDLIKETQSFAKSIAQTTGEKHIRYSLTVNTPNDSLHPKLDFKVHSSCNLNKNQKNCSTATLINKENHKTKQFTYNKTTRFEEIEFQLAERELSS